MNIKRIIRGCLVGVAVAALGPGGWTNIVAVVALVIAFILTDEDVTA